MIIKKHRIEERIRYLKKEKKKVSSSNTKSRYNALIRQLEWVLGK